MHLSSDLSRQYEAVLAMTKKKHVKSDTDDYAKWIPILHQYKQLLEDYLGYDVMTGSSLLDPSGDASSVGTKRKGYDSSVSFMLCTVDWKVLN